MRRLTTQEFIEKAREIHGNTYDYSETEYVKSRQNVIIICHKHGAFGQMPNAHLNGQGCPICGREHAAHTRMISTQDFILRAKCAHGDVFDYSNTVYKGYDKYIEFVCPVHGVVRETPYAHLNGIGCPVCAEESRHNKRRKSLDTFVEQARSKHGDKYDYSNVEYINVDTPVKIVCPEHGCFEQTPYNHLTSRGCPECSRAYVSRLFAKTTDEFIRDAREVHGSVYDYSEVNYVDINTPVTIVCHKHGQFLQKPAVHLLGCGCPQCASEAARLSRDEIIVKARARHGNVYEYGNLIQEHNRVFIEVFCKEHGRFVQRVDGHLAGKGCPVCGYIQAIDTKWQNGTMYQSYLETEVFNFVKRLLGGVDVIRNDRKIVSPGVEYDIVVPSRNVAIEVNGVFWHSELYHGKFDAFTKFDLARKSGFQLITLWEDDWLEHDDICKIMLSSKLDALSSLPLYESVDEKVSGIAYARDLNFVEISNVSANEFFSRTHIQGASALTRSFALVDEDGDIRAACGICSAKQNARVHAQSGTWEIRRYATCGHVPGGFSKLLKHIEQTLGDELDMWVSFSSNDVSDGHMYEACGFIADKHIDPDYSYAGSLTKWKRRSKQVFQKKKFRTDENLCYDDSMTEHELALLNKLYRVYDSGKVRWVKCVVSEEISVNGSE